MCCSRGKRVSAWVTRPDTFTLDSWQLTNAFVEKKNDDVMGDFYMFVIVMTTISSLNQDCARCYMFWLLLIFIIVFCCLFVCLIKATLFKNKPNQKWSLHVTFYWPCYCKENYFTTSVSFYCYPMRLYCLHNVYMVITARCM